MQCRVPLRCAVSVGFRKRFGECDYPLFRAAYQTLDDGSQDHCLPFLIFLSRSLSTTHPATHPELRPLFSAQGFPKSVYT